MRLMFAVLFLSGIFAGNLAYQDHDNLGFIISLVFATIGFYKLIEKEEGE